MAEVKINVAGRVYAMHCRDGEEGRLHQLARMIGERVEKVKTGNPGLTEVRQLLFGAILLADELLEQELKVQSAVRDVPTIPDTDQIAFAATLEALAERLEAISEGLAADLASA